MRDKLRNVCDRLMTGRYQQKQIVELTKACHEQFDPIRALAETPKLWPRNINAAALTNIEVELGLLDEAVSISKEIVSGAERLYRSAVNQLIQAEVLARQGSTQAANDIEAVGDSDLLQVAVYLEGMAKVREIAEISQASLGAILK